MISKNEIPYSLVLHPTAQEFANFSDFWEKTELDKKTSQYGIIKIVPPAKWKPRAVPIEQVMDDITVNSPIEQNVYGKGGIYELLLEQKKSMSVRDYRKKVESFDTFTDNKNPEDVENLFWKSICFNAPLYGADMKGSLFDPGVKWNLRELDGVLKDGLQQPIDGVNVPYLYVGSWKTMFGWHKEDLDLYSINFVHYGKPKFWYSIPFSEGPKLEKFAKKTFGDGFSRCKEYLRHKTLMISPYVLKQQIPDLKIHKMIHNPGEFIVTLGGCYHAGFNWGFNLAEAVNFATTRWLDLFPNADCCKCVTDNVKIDKENFYHNLGQSSFAEHPAIKKYFEEESNMVDQSNTLSILNSSTSTTKSKSMKSRKISSEKSERKYSSQKGSPDHTVKQIKMDERMDTEHIPEPAPIVQRKMKSTGKKTKKTTNTKLAAKIEKMPKKKSKPTATTTKEDNNIENKQKEEANISLNTKSKKIRKGDLKVATDRPEIRKTILKPKTPEEAVIIEQKPEPIIVEQVMTVEEAPNNIMAEVDTTDDRLNWVTCDSCFQWRKIADKGHFDRIVHRKKFKCKELKGISCDIPEEDLNGYETIPKKNAP